MRDSFDNYEAEARLLVSSEYKESRKRQRKTFYDEDTGNEAVLTPKERFRTQTFLVILDSLLVEMKKRSNVYQIFRDRFDFLTNYDMPSDQCREKSEELVTYYKCELESEFTEELLLLRQMVISEAKEKKTVSELLRYVILNNLTEAFPNACIAFRIYLSIFGTSCEGERSFSTLKRIKNYSRSTMGQEKLTDLSLLCIESEMMRKLKMTDIIHRFASKKCRKATI
jgi:hypothetical protein